MSEDNKKIKGGIKKIGEFTLYGGALFFVLLLVLASFNSKKDNNINKTNNQSQLTEGNNSKNLAQKNPAEKIQIFLFHSTNRCYSCVTAGEYTKKLLEEDFSQELNSGKIEFREINIDLAENKDLTNKFKASGTSLFINSIIDGEDNIKEDAQIWRLVSNEKSFSDYLSKKIRSIISETVSVENKKEVEEKNITFYTGDNCSSCESVKKYLLENNVKNVIAFEEKNINEIEANFEQMAEDAMYCNMDEESFGVPFLWAEGRCYADEKEITDFFRQKLASFK